MGRRRSTLSRVLPSTIDVRVVERTPMAIARLGQQLYLVDDTGVIIDEYGAAYREFDLPIVDGLVSPGRQRRRSSTPSASQLTGAFLDGARRAARICASGCRRSTSPTPHDVVVMFDDDPVWLHLGDDAVRRAAAAVPRAGADACRSGSRTIDYVDLRFDERVFVPARRGRDGEHVLETWTGAS